MTCCLSRNRNVIGCFLIQMIGGSLNSIGNNLLYFTSYFYLCDPDVTFETLTWILNIRSFVMPVLLLFGGFLDKYKGSTKLLFLASGIYFLMMCLVTMTVEREMDVMWFIGFMGCGLAFFAAFAYPASQQLIKDTFANEISNLRTGIVQLGFGVGAAVDILAGFLIINRNDHDLQEKENGNGERLYSAEVANNVKVFFYYFVLKSAVFIILALIAIKKPEPQLPINQPAPKVELTRNVVKHIKRVSSPKHEFMKKSTFSTENISSTSPKKEHNEDTVIQIAKELEFQASPSGSTNSGASSENSGESERSELEEAQTAPTLITHQDQTNKTRFCKAIGWTFFGILTISIICVFMDLSFMLNYSKFAKDKKFTNSVSTIVYAIANIVNGFARLGWGKAYSKYKFKTMYVIMFGSTIFFGGMLFLDNNTWGIIIFVFLFVFFNSGNYPVIFHSVASVYEDKNLKKPIYSLILISFSVSAWMGYAHTNYLIKYIGYTYSALVIVLFFIPSFFIIRCLCRVKELNPKKSLSEEDSSPSRKNGF